MRFSLIILILGLGQSLSAQFNIAVGYTMGYTPAEEINKLVSKFNEDFNVSYFGDEMPDLHFLNGLTLGARWKYDRYSLELNWERMNRTREAIGENSMDLLFQKTVFYNINNYSAGIDSHFGNFGLGLAIGLSNFEIKEEIASTGKKRTFLEDQQYFLKPSFSINLAGSDKLGLTIKPYLKIPFSSIGLNALSEEFNLGNSDATESLWMGGVSFIFYNGNQ